MKLTNILSPILLALSLVGCDEAINISGAYENSNNEILNITQSKDGKKYVVATEITLDINGQERKLPYKVVTYEKGGSLYELSGDALVGTIEKDNFILSKNGLTYKKKL